MQAITFSGIEVQRLVERAFLDGQRSVGLDETEIRGLFQLIIDLKPLPDLSGPKMRLFRANKPDRYHAIFEEVYQAEHDRQRIDALLLRDDPRPERLLVTSP